MDKKQYAISRVIKSIDVKTVRNKLKMTQKDFSEFIGCSKTTIERLENATESIDGPIALLINLLENNIDYIQKMEIPKKIYPLRLYYMKDQVICTVIDVDIINQKVLIKNFTDNLLYRAFGINLSPTYLDYQNFLKSRCFPETRDKLKLVLKDLEIPFYDPLLIIRRTEGRMSEDDFWIRIEE